MSLRLKDLTKELAQEQENWRSQVTSRHVELSRRLDCIYSELDGKVLIVLVSNLVFSLIFFMLKLYALDKETARLGAQIKSLNQTICGNSSSS